MFWGSASLLVLCLLSIPACAQNTPVLKSLGQKLAKVSNAVLPNAPSPAEAEPIVPGEPVRGKYETLTEDPYQPLSAGEKWHHFLNRTHASATFVGVAEDTIFTRATGGFMYCCGIGSWGEQYAATLADTESRQFFGNFLFPTLLRQDPRYVPKRRGSVMSRAWYAATRVVITRNDSGRAAPNYSEFLGVAFSKALSNAYYPDHDRGGFVTANNILGTFQSDATTNLLREFWPDIRRLVHKHTPKGLRGLAERMPIPDATSQY